MYVIRKSHLITKRDYKMCLGTYASCDIAQIFMVKPSSRKELKWKYIHNLREKLGKKYKINNSFPSWREKFFTSQTKVHLCSYNDKLW